MLLLLLFPGEERVAVRGGGVAGAAAGWRCRSRPAEGPAGSEATKEGGRGRG